MKKIYVCVVALCACSCVFANLPDEYSINQGETITLTGSAPESWTGGGLPYYAQTDIYGIGSCEEVHFEWYIDSTQIYIQTAGMDNPQITFDELTNALGLGLSLGQHTVQMNAYWICYVPYNDGPPHAWPFNDCIIIADTQQFSAMEDIIYTPYEMGTESYTAVLNIIPEPTTMLLLSIGAIVSRRRRN